MKEKLFNRNFSFLILGQVSSLLGNLTLKFALSMYILEQTGSASLFAGLLAASMVPTILLSPFGGVLADRADGPSWWGWTACRALRSCWLRWLCPMGLTWPSSPF